VGVAHAHPYTLSRTCCHEGFALHPSLPHTCPSLPLSLAPSLLIIHSVSPNPSSPPAWTLTAMATSPLPTGLLLIVMEEEGWVGSVPQEEEEEEGEGG